MTEKFPLRDILNHDRLVKESLLHPNRDPLVYWLDYCRTHKHGSMYADKILCAMQEVWDD